MAPTTTPTPTAVPTITTAMVAQSTLLPTVIARTRALAVVVRLAINEWMARKAGRYHPPVGAWIVLPVLGERARAGRGLRSIYSIGQVV